MKIIKILANVWLFGGMTKKDLKKIETWINKNQSIQHWMGCVQDGKLEPEK